MWVKFSLRRMLWFVAAICLLCGLLVVNGRKNYYQARAVTELWQIGACVQTYEMKEATLLAREIKQGLFNAWFSSPQSITFFGNVNLQAVPYLEQLALVDAIVFVNSDLSDVSLKGLGRFPALDTMWFTRCNVQPTAVDALKQIQLREIQFHQCTVPDVFFDRFHELKSVTSIELMGMPLQDEQISGLSAIPNLTQLRLRSLTNVNFLVEPLLDLGELESLTFEKIQVDASDVMHLRKLSGLREIVFIDCPQITKEEIRKLRDFMPRCKVLAQTFVLGM